MAESAAYWQDRLGREAAAIAALEDALDDEMRRRNIDIVAAVDDGFSVQHVAEWARLSRTRVHKVLSVPPALLLAEA